MAAVTTNYATTLVVWRYLRFQPQRPPQLLRAITGTVNLDCLTHLSLCMKISLAMLGSFCQLSLNIRLTILLLATKAN